MVLAYARVAGAHPGGAQCEAEETDPRATRAQRGVRPILATQVSES